MIKIPSLNIEMHFIENQSNLTLDLGTTFYNDIFDIVKKPSHPVQAYLVQGQLAIGSLDPGTNFHNENFDVVKIPSYPAQAFETCSIDGNVSKA